MDKSLPISVMGVGEEIKNNLWLSSGTTDKVFAIPPPCKTQIFIICIMLIFICLYFAYYLHYAYYLEPFTLFRNFFKLSFSVNWVLAAAGVEFYS